MIKFIILVFTITWGMINISNVLAGRGHGQRGHVQNRPQIQQHIQNRPQAQHQQNVQQRREQPRFNQYYAVPYYPGDVTSYIINGSPDNGSYVTTSNGELPPPSYPTNTPAPNQEWVSAQNGLIPNHAIELQIDSKGNRTYTCRVQYQNKIYQGVLVVFDACYVQDQSTSLRFTEYQVLVKSY